ncbi:hypothetical protein ACEQ8H_006109 [Pleosporales sp. CAS-2024a]
MSVLAFKAIGYGAEQIPDKFFEKIPGGFFTPPEKKQAKGARGKQDKHRHRSEERSGRRSSRRDRSPQNDDSDYSACDDTDHEHARSPRKKDRSRRAKSAGRSSSRSWSRGRHHQRSSDLDGQSSEAGDMAHAEQGEPYFAPPPTSEYRPYSPQAYAPGRPQGDYRPASPAQPYGYPTQVNHSSRSHSVAFAPTATFSPRAPAPSMTCPPRLMGRPSSKGPLPAPPPQLPVFDFLRHGTPLSAVFSPSTEPPLAALFSRPPTNSPKPAAVPPHSSASAARYTPGPGYAPSPAVNTNIPAAPASPYAPYNPSEYAASAGGYHAPGNAYPSPPPLNRQRSNSQPASPPYPTYMPPSADQRMAAYDSSAPGHRSSTKPRHEHRHRARSADSHSSRRHDSHNPDSSRMTKMRERFDEGFARDSGGLAAAVGGAAAGALGGQAMASRRSKSRGARSRSRSRSRSRTRSRARRDDRDRPSGLRARSKSIVDRFRSKSRGGDDGDSRSDRYDSRPDHGYDRHDRGVDEYEYFSSESEGDGSPVRRRRHKSVHRRR